MVRAGIFIGVDRTGNLPRLNDAAAGARRMYEWALAQGMANESHAKLITDENAAKVGPDQIYDAIKAIVDGAGVDQLLVYFAGHGVNIGRSEQWLLSDAPVRTSAAVNLAGSVELARYCGIGHVVFISDACRVAPDGIQAQNVRGVDVFPNDGGSERAKPVDQFFACFLGRTAAELRDPAVASANFSALYTNTLLDGLKGMRADLLEPAQSAEDKSLYVRPHKLENYLEIEVPARVKQLGLALKVNQNPDAIITSNESWLSRVAAAAAPPAQRVMRGGVLRAAPAIPNNLRVVTQSLVRSAADGDGRGLSRQMQTARIATTSGVSDLVGTTERIAAPFGPDRFESQCGFKVRGARIAAFFAPGVQASLLGPENALMRIDAVDGPVASVVLLFEGGFGTVIPAIPGFIAALSFDDGELIDVSYEPSSNSRRWTAYAPRVDETRMLRALAASSSQHGRFRLEQQDPNRIAQRIAYADGIDPTLALYAAYAYHDLQAIDRIREMSQRLHHDIGGTLFDLALLGRALFDKGIAQADCIVPFVPLLARGWSLLGANRVRLHPALDGIERSVRDSPWTLYDVAGLDKLKAALNTREVR